MNKWIRVSQLLPSEGIERVLIYLPSIKDIEIAEFDHFLENFVIHGFLICKPIYWMPLPMLPNKYNIHNIDVDSNNVIKDGFGNAWNKYCEYCSGELEVVRPGKVQCPNCG